MFPNFRTDSVQFELAPSSSTRDNIITAEDKDLNHAMTMQSLDLQGNLKMAERQNDMRSSSTVHISLQIG